MPQPTAFDTILVQCRDLFRDRLSEAVGKMFDGADAALTELADKTKDDEQKRYLDARDLVLANRQLMEEDFAKRYITEFQKATKKAKKIGETVSDFSLDDLALVEDDDLNETLKFNAMAEKLRRMCDDELSALDQRVGVLLGDAALEADANPIGPKVICDAYKHACRTVECPADVRMVFLKLFDDSVADTVRASYKEVNELLVENQILPKIRFAVSKHEGKSPPPKAAGAPEEKAPGEAPPSEQDVFAMLAKAMGGGAGGAAPAAGMGVGGVPIVQGAELMNSLSQLQVGNLAALGEAAAELGPILAEAGNLKNILHQLKSTSVGAGMGQVDAMTLDVVAMLFDQLFDDDKVPIALKGLIGRLQMPMLKVAIADKELFSSKSHPARQLLDVLGQIGLRLPPDFDNTSPLFPRLEAFIQELEKGFQEKMEIFDKVRADLEGIVDEHDKQVAEAMKASEKALQQAETLAIAKAAAQDEIRARVEAAPAAPRPVCEFLAQQWIKPLMIAHARDGKGSAGWKEGLETVDQLLWSVAPKPTMDDRRALARAIPALLKRVKDSIALGTIDADAAADFLPALMKCHTELMQAAPPPPPPPPQRKPEAATAKAGAAAMAKPAAPGAPAAKGGAAAAKPAAAAPGAKAAAGAKPAPAAPAKPSADDLLDFTAPVTVENPFGGGKVEVSADELDFTSGVAPALEEAKAETAKPAAPGAKPDGAKPEGGKPARAPKPRDTIRLPSALIVGAWVEVVDVENDKSQAARLHYVSPMKSHFLFVDRKGAKVFECSRSMLARRIKLGEVRILEGEPDASLFDRIMEGLFGKLKAAPA
jgi:uncharacterized protein DUF1631